MKRVIPHKASQVLVMIMLAVMLSGCLEWLRAYQTYLQLNEFDTHFEIKSAEDFTLLFKHPILISDDFVNLSKLQPSESIPLEFGKRWRYWFKKVNDQGELIRPEINFFFDLRFNRFQRLTAFTFSPLFLQIAPPDFIEASLRSIAGAKINEEKRQLRTNAEMIQKTNAKLPLKSAVIAQLGEPLEITQENGFEIYRYHFMLQTTGIVAGYEDRALNAVKLTFDMQTQELVKMAGRFAGLKISINYRKYLDQDEQSL
jgi:hypothetical protein